MIDVVTLSVLRGRLEEVADEMDVTLFRTAFNPVIAEARDACHGIYHPHTGETLIQGKSGLPIFVGAMSFAVKTIIDKIERDGDLADGDVYVMNDPYRGGTHLNDFKLVTPVFFEGKVVCYLASAAHWTDVGGNVPGNFNAGARESFQEGVLIPPTKLARGFKLRDEIVAILTSISRTPTNCFGDVRGQISALQLGTERMKEILRDYGETILSSAFEELRERAASLTRVAIRALPDGTYKYDDYLDNDGFTDEKIRIAVDVTIAGENITFDFSRTSKAVTGPLNISYPTTVAACYVAIKHLFPDVVANSGCLVPVRIVVPEDSLLNVKHPKPLCGYTETVARIVDVIFGAVAQAAPEIANGLPHGTINAISISGSHPAGDSWVFFLFFGGGLGGSPVSDGLNNGSPPIGTATMPPAEILESRYPVLFRQWALQPDSGGAGYHRGGLGAHYEIELLAERALYSHFGDRTRSQPGGIAGGHAAAGSRVEMERDGAFHGLPLGGKLVGAPLQKGQRIRLETPGGGGYGPPEKRDPKKIERDIRLGYVSRKAAEQDYPGLGSPEDAASQPLDDKR
jgi:N-methylhydantoinase B